MEVPSPSAATVDQAVGEETSGLMRAVLLHHLAQKVQMVGRVLTEPPMAQVAGVASVP
jgi:hypothetical protein